MAQETASKEHVQLPKPAYRLLKKVYRSVQRFTFIVTMNERNGLPTSKTKVV